jgi:hypothetical protein
MNVFAGVSIVVSMRGYQIDIALTVPDEFHNISLSGLFGNFNGNPDDDLVNANGENLDANSSEETIYRSFGETCKLNCVTQVETCPVVMHD